MYYIEKSSIFTSTVPLFDYSCTQLRSTVATTKLTDQCEVESSTKLPKLSVYDYDLCDQMIEVGREVQVGSICVYVTPGVQEYSVLTT